MIFQFLISLSVIDTFARTLKSVDSQEIVREKLKLDKFQDVTGISDATKTEIWSTTLSSCKFSLKRFTIKIKI